jgi:hypothetical protein
VRRRTRSPRRRSRPPRRALRARHGGQADAECLEQSAPLVLKIDARVCAFPDILALLLSRIQFAFTVSLTQAPQGEDVRARSSPIDAPRFDEIVEPASRVGRYVGGR